MLLAERNLPTLKRRYGDKRFHVNMLFAQRSRPGLKLFSITTPSPISSAPARSIILISPLAASPFAIMSSMKSTLSPSPINWRDTMISVTMPLVKDGTRSHKASGSASSVFAPGEYHGNSQFKRCGKGNRYAGGFQRNDLGHAALFKSRRKFPAHVHNQCRINLVRQQGIQLQHLIRQHDAFFNNPLL